MRFSIIIPAQKPERFRLTLVSLLNQSFPTTDYEIIIIDDSGGKIGDSISRFRSQLAGYSWSYHLVGYNRGRSVARNIGLRQAKGDIVLFFDDDMIASPTLIAVHDQYQRRGFSAVMEGKPNNTLSIWYKGWFDSIALNSRKLILDSKNPHLIKYIDYEPEDSRTKILILEPEDIIEHFDRVYTLTYTHENKFHTLFGDELTELVIPWISGGTSNLAVRRDLAIDVGGFDEDFVGWGFEDLEFEYRLHQVGTRFAMASSAVSFHQLHPRNWREMMRSSVQNYKRFYQKHPNLIVQLFIWYRMGGLSIHSYNDIARREKFGEITSAEIAKAQEYYRRFAQMSEEAVVNQWLDTAFGLNNWYEKRAGI
jgi:glycosyltransferase involved in cell wall biosynthesis